MAFGMILFGIVALLAIASAVGLVTATNAVHAALFLVLNFISVALVYLGLNAPFLAVVQITVYAGAIMVLFLFVIMLLGAERVEIQSSLRWQTPLALVLVLALLAVSAVILLNPQYGVSATELPPTLGAESVGNGAFGSPAAVGMVLFTGYVLPFEIVGVLLLVAMIGAVILTKDDKPKVATRYGWQEMQEQVQQELGQRQPSGD